jgi:hypothetical protein
VKKLILAILFLNMACHEPKDTENCHHSIKFINNTEKVLFIDYSSDTIIYSKDIRQDPFYKSVVPFAGNNNIKIGEIRFVSNGKPICIEDLYNPNEKLYVFVYDSLAIGNKDWNEVKKEYLVTKRYEYTVNELRINNFTIVYNGEKGYSTKMISKLKK